MKKISIIDWYAATSKSFNGACLYLSKQSGSPIEGYAFDVTIYGFTASIKHDRYSKRINLYLPVMDTTKSLTITEADKLSAYIWHEMAHVLYTSEVVYPDGYDQARIHKLCNGLEDARIEKILIDSGMLPGVRDCLETLINSCFDDFKTSGAAPFDDPIQWPFALALFGRSALSDTVKRLPACPACLLNAIEELKSAKSTQDCLNIAQKLMNQEDQDQGGDNNQDQDQGGDNNQDQGGDNNQDQDQGQDGKSKKSETEGREFIPSGINDIVQDKEGEYHHASMIEQWEKKVTQRSMKDDILEDRTIRMKEEQNRRLEKYNNISSLKHAIREMLRSPSKSGIRKNQVIGRLDRRSLVACSIDRKDVMEKKWFQDGKNTVVHIAVDASGSMNHGIHYAGREKKIEQASDFLKIFSDVIASAGCKLTVSLFSTSVYSLCNTKERIKSDTIQKRISNLPYNLHSNTNTMLGLMDGYNKLKDVQGAKKLLIVITDGDDDEGWQRVTATTKLIASKGISVLGISVGGYDITGQYPYSINIPTSGSLVNEGLKEINKVLRSINQ